MRVSGSVPVRVNASIAPREIGRGTFSLATPTVNAMVLSRIGAVVAQPATAMERRRKAVAAGRNVLDRLDGLKAGMLSGTIGETLGSLARALAALEPYSGDPDLDETLDAVRLRAEVEIAKREADSDVNAAKKWPR